MAGDIRRIETAMTLTAEGERILKEEIPNIPPPTTPITMNKAAVKYGVDSKTIRNWVYRGLVTVLSPGKGQGSKRLVDERDIAVRVATSEVKPGRPRNGDNLG